MATAVPYIKNFGHRLVVPTGVHELRTQFMVIVTERGGLGIS